MNIELTLDEMIILLRGLYTLRKIHSHINGKRGLPEIEKLIAQWEKIYSGAN